MTEIVRTENYLEVITGKIRHRLIPVTDGIIRCITARKEIDGEIHSNLVEVQEEKKVSFDVERDNERILLKTEKVTVQILEQSGQITWMYPNGETWLEERGRELTEKEVIHYTTGGEEPVVQRVRTVDGERNFIQNLKPEVVRNAYRGRIFFQWKEAEGIHGLGQGEDGIYNYRGRNQYLYQHNMRIPMPFFVSTEGYGFLTDCCSLMTFCDEGKDSYLFLDTVDQIDTYFLGGDSMDEIIHMYRFLTGKAQMLPKWAYGYIQSKEQYHTARELLDVVKAYRKRNVPLDCVVQDWNTWIPGNWGEKIADDSRYGDLEKCMEEIHELHARAMVSVWPNMNFGGENHTEFKEAGFLLNDLATYDAFNEKAREMYWNQAKRGLFERGFDAWWCDSTEPFSGPDWNGETKREPWERFALVGGEHKKYIDPGKANIYALQHAKGIYENQRKDCKTKRVLNLTRSGYVSGQKYGAVLWSGDTTASWETLREQITEGLNVGLSGYPYWTLDIGGFFTVGEKWENRGCGCNQDSAPKWFWKGKYDEGCKDLAYCELYTRWLQFGTFLPMFRSHGTDTPREIWNFGEKGSMFYDTIESFIKLRYHLMPYIYSLAGAVHFRDATIMRSLLFDFREDKVAHSISDQFMFGPSLLICPVTEPMYYDVGNVILDRKKTWDCYLPEGCGWYDYWTESYYEGGQIVTVDAAIDKIPIFVKAGSILPTIEGIQYADQEPQYPMKLNIYPGADCDFVMYEDEGDGYRFEDGVYRETILFWNDNLQTLEVKGQNGKYHSGGGDFLKSGIVLENVEIKGKNPKKSF